jgi:hypothetical protein
VFIKNLNPEEGRMRRGSGGVGRMGNTFYVGSTKITDSDGPQAVPDPPSGESRLEKE